VLCTRLSCQVFEDIYDAKNALENLNGFNVIGRYLVVLYYQPEKTQRRINMEKEKKEIEQLRRQMGQSDK
jgi:pre-mRNA branch site protein p14